jgi:hypothetical protein
MIHDMTSLIADGGAKARMGEFDPCSEGQEWSDETAFHTMPQPSL